MTFNNSLFYFLSAEYLVFLLVVSKTPSVWPHGRTLARDYRYRQSKSSRYLEHDEHIGAGSVEICRATFLLDARKKGEDKEKLISVEGKLDTCGSVSLSHSSHLQLAAG